MTLTHADLNGARFDTAKRLDPRWRIAWEIVNRPQAGRLLAGANLQGANLKQATLQAANLKNADLRSSQLEGANLAGADLAGARLRQASIDDTTQLDVKWRQVWEIVNSVVEGRALNRPISPALTSVKSICGVRN
ncbi:MAG: pentapeptide repeat-containing protein [Anaerolineales bacterium]|nr:pentapeptide repeat-containing protein [Anaerolineales bacterium]